MVILAKRGLVIQIGTYKYKTSCFVHLKPFAVRCKCGHCQPMPTVKKCVCCQEIDKIKVLLVGDPVPACITQHLEFSSVFLCRTVLTIAGHGHQHRYGTSSIPTDENR